MLKTILDIILPNKADNIQQKAVNWLYAVVAALAVVAKILGVSLTGGLGQ